MRMLDAGLDDIRRGSSLQDAAQRLIDSSPRGRTASARLRPPAAHARSARGAAHAAGDGARARRGAHTADAHDRAAARVTDGPAGRGHADERGRRDCRGVRRPRTRLRDSATRCSSSRASRASSRTLMKSGCASRRCVRSTRPTTFTTARRNAGSPKHASRSSGPHPPCDETRCDRERAVAGTRHRVGAGTARSCRAGTSVRATSRTRSRDTLQEPREVGAIGFAHLPHKGRVRHRPSLGMPASSVEGERKQTVRQR